jgi:hypothetical protein
LRPFNQAEEQIGAQRQRPMQQPLGVGSGRAGNNLGVGSFDAEPQGGQRVRAHIDREHLRGLQQQ